jgi:ubiquinone/menaquinone biosynthesis C-methylase UbiE
MRKAGVFGHAKGRRERSVERRQCGEGIWGDSEHMTTHQLWHDSANANEYHAFATSQTMYTWTNRSLVSHAALADEVVVVDLACGTGITARVILQHAPRIGRLICVDGSEAMLRVARQYVRDERVEFVCSEAERLDEVVEGANTIIVSSAVWQFDATKTVAAMERSLRAGGRVCFNIPTIVRSKVMEQFLAIVFETARCEYGWAHQPNTKSFNRDKWNQLIELFQLSGLELVKTENVHFAVSLDENYRFFRIPRMSDMLLPGLPYPDQIAILERAVKLCDTRAPIRNLWINHTLVKRSSCSDGRCARSATAVCG